ncbi:MAG: 50S ribosomal protein L28 [Alphaproteobacteria bacterium]
MSRRCEITGKGVLSGNNVSHANNKTRRRFLPNLQEISFTSETLGASYKIKTSAHGLRTIEHKGGFDAFLLNTSAAKLPAEMKKLKKKIEKKLAAATAA